MDKMQTPGQDLYSSVVYCDLETVPPPATYYEARNQPQQLQPQQAFTKQEAEQILVQSHHPHEASNRQPVVSEFETEHTTQVLKTELSSGPLKGFDHSKQVEPSIEKQPEFVAPSDVKPPTFVADKPEHIRPAIVPVAQPDGKPPAFAAQASGHLPQFVAKNGQAADMRASSSLPPGQPPPRQIPICAFCGGMLRDQYSTLGIILAIICFPFGLLCCIKFREMRCSICGR